MTFLNPSILFALFAISIPIIIHFFNLRKLKKVEFSTLMFLKELQKSKMKRIKLKQLLLLLFRILVITFLVLAFANPVYKGMAGSSSSSSASLIIIDNSFSMSAKDAYGEYLEQAKISASDIISTLNPSDEIIIMPSSELGKSSPVYWTNTQSNYKDSIKNIAVSYKDYNIEESLEFAKSLLNKTTSLNKNIFIVSDFQKNNFGTVNNNAVSDYSLFAVNIGNLDVSNISLEDFKIESAIIEKERDVKLSINVHNYSQYALANKTLNVYSQNNDSNFILKGEKVVDLQSSENKKVELTFKAEKSGNNSGMIELVLDNSQDDEIKYDNKIYFSFYIPEKFKIGLFGNDTRFIKLAVESASSILDSGVSKNNLFEVNELSFIPSKISDFNIVFISGIDKFGNSEAEQLSNYISNGGTVYIFPSQSAEINSYNSLFTKLNSAHFTDLNSDAEANKSIKIGRVNFEHALLSGIFKNEKLNFTSEKFILDSPELKSFYTLTPGEKDVTLIELSNNKPFLIENNVGQGRFLLSAVSANDKMSDFPMKSIFVPLIVRSIFYSQGNINQTVYTIGKNNVVSLNQSFKVSSAINPVKNKINYSPAVFSSYLALPYSNFSSVPGIYSLADSSGTHYSFALNFNQSESNLGKEDTKEIEKYFRKSFVNVRMINDINQIKESVKEAKLGTELWKYFLILSLIFVVAEIFLSRKIMQE